MEQTEDTIKHRLKVIRRIGKGAYGEVFKGTLDGQTVAIKVLDACITGEADKVDMMRQEAAVLCKCHHRRIIGYRALCTLAPHKRAGRGRWALVLEYANGGSLCDKVSAQMISPARKVYSAAQALGWALDLACALQHLHTRSPMILHRDVKLSNVVLVEEGGALVAKLADMGLHMVVDDSKHSLRRASSISDGDGIATAAAVRQPMPRGPMGLTSGKMPPAGCCTKVAADEQAQLHNAHSACGGGMATGATWLAEAGHAAPASIVTGTPTGTSRRSVWDSSMKSSAWASEFERVFDMTGQTGSCMTMAPEVFLGQPYNEKADVFSFGVVLYELAARCLLIFTELPTSCSDPAITEWYAAKVARGYRPAQPKHISPGVWQLIEACWHQEPCARPGMAQAVEVLQGLLADELAAKSVERHRRTGKAAAPAAAAPAAAAAPLKPNDKDAAAVAAESTDAGSRTAEAAVLQPGCCVIS